MENEREHMSEIRHPQGTLVAVDTPWREDGRLDERRFRELIAQRVALDFDEYYVMGTAGEGYAVSDEDYREIVNVFVNEMAGRGKRIQVGVISLSTSQLIGRVAHAHRQGVRTFQISLPSWSTVTDPEMLTFFKTVCGEFPDSSFLHYNTNHTGRIISGAEYLPLIAEVPNLAATKQSSTDMKLIRSFMVDAPELQHFFLECSYAYGATYGECSLLCSPAGIAPHLTRALWESGRSGNIARALCIQRRFLEAHQGLFGHVESAHMDGAFDKLFAWLIDPSFPRRLPPPYATISDAEAETAKQWYEANHDWFR